MNHPLIFNRLTAWFLLLSVSLLQSKVVATTQLTVAADGSGDFRTIQAALDSVPVAGREPLTINIRDGLYYEKVRINRDRVTLRGESRKGVRIRYYLPRTEYDRRYDQFGVGVVNVFADDVVIENLTIENTQQSREHAFALYGQPNRFILRDCDVLSEGADTVSLWNTSFGMYYHTNCRFRGGVDFVCPRGWCYVSDCQFECPTTSAAIWQDGHMNPDMKFVLRNCTFTGVEDFWIGRNHYPSQFYLLDCTFGENMADKPILRVKDLPPEIDEAPYEQKYFHNCHRTGGDYAWHADNLDQAPGQPAPEAITAEWTFDGRWNPESRDPPRIRSVQVEDDAIHLYLSEPVAGVNSTTVQRADGSAANYESGSGTAHLIFRGGEPTAEPKALQFGNDYWIGTIASLQPRYLKSTDLQTATPREELTLVLIGDSTVSDYAFDHAYQGWGRSMPDYFDDRVRVVNFARGGRSSKSFRTEGWWEKAVQAKPDYVFIQFGHNDNPGKGPERHTDPGPDGDFRQNLRRYIQETRELGAKPILVSPPTRRKFDEHEKIIPHEGNIPYAEATLAVAQEEDCPVVDLNLLTRQLFERLGEPHSEWLQPVGDRTHFTPAGADRIAGLVVGVLPEEVPELQPFINRDPAERLKR